MRNTFQASCTRVTLQVIHSNLELCVSLPLATNEMQPKRDENEEEAQTKLIYFCNRLNE